MKTSELLDLGFHPASAENLGDEPPEELEDGWVHEDDPDFGVRPTIFSRKEAEAMALAMDTLGLGFMDAVVEADPAPHSPRP